MFRKIVFWSHLVAGVLAGLVIAMMSATGVLLTYEHQLSRGWLPSNGAEELAATDRLPLDALLDTVRAQGIEPTGVTVFRDSRSAVLIDTPRGQPSYYVDAFDGASLGEVNTATRDFLATTRAIHRWFALQGDARASGRAVTATANLMFLFLVLSGIYLWFPRVFSRAALSRRLTLVRGVNARTRDFYWHHFFGFWGLIPLLLIVMTATVFYFPQANRLVYGAFGESPPERGSRGTVAETNTPARYLPLQTLMVIAEAQAEWRTISLRLPQENPHLTFTLDQGTGRQPQLRHTLTLDRGDGRIVEWLPFSDRTPGGQARRIVRFLHTGEVFGVVGQTVAGLASAFALVMVWTGLALAYRRLLQPLFQ